MLTTILDKLRSEPVRVRLYSVAALVLGFLLTKHVLGADDIEFILSVLGIVLGVETARAKVTPYHADEHAVAQDYGYDDPADEVGDDELTQSDLDELLSHDEKE